jgi:hypothetical protein
MRDQMRDPIPNPDDIDLLLDSALATYADPGPGSGLEERVIAALAAARAETPTKTLSRHWRWLPWAIAVPVAACVILLWIVASTRVVRAPLTLPQQASRSDQPQSPSVRGQEIREMRPSGAIDCCKTNVLPRNEKQPQILRLRPPRRTPLRMTKESAYAGINKAPTQLPKLDVFPTPQPLTEQEQALLAFAQQAPAGQVEALSAVQAQDEESFALAASHIPPFEPPAEGKN